jgi:hypothetical protein
MLNSLNIEIIEQLKISNRIRTDPPALTASYLKMRPKRRHHVFGTSFPSQLLDMMLFEEYSA